LKKRLPVVAEIL